MNFKSANIFNEIYTSYYRKSYLFVKSYIHDDMASEDIVTEALIKLWEKMKQQSIDPISPFLFTILKNKSLDYLKHQTIRQGVHDSLSMALNRELILRTTALEASDPISIFSDEVQLIIETTLNSLPEKTREIFVLSRFGNNTHKEIAEFYGISVKGVDYHISQSVKQLRLSLKDYLPILYALSFLH